MMGAARAAAWQVAKTFTDSMYFKVPTDFEATEEQDDDFDPFAAAYGGK